MVNKTITKALRLAILSLPFRRILGRWGSDDMFYYAQIAGNLTAGRGVTFDGETVTNGFQPLYFALLLPLGPWLHNQPVVTTYLLLTVASVLTLLAAWQFARLCEDLDAPALGWMAAAVTVLHPKVLSVTFNGTEAALILLFMALLMRALVWVQWGQRLLASALVFMGVALCRLDLAFMLAMVALWLGWRGLPLRPILLVFSPALLALALLLGTNWVWRGSVVPDSGVAKQLHAALAVEAGVALTPRQLLSDVADALMRGAFPERRRLVWLAAAGGVVVVAADIFTVGGFREWYLMPLYTAVIFAMARALHLGWERLGRWRLALLAVPMMWWGAANERPREHMAPTYLDAAARLRTQLPPGTRIGALNSGLFGAALGPTHTVINLDGVVNHEVLRHLAHRTLDRYIAIKQISTVLDHRGSVVFYSGFAQRPLLAEQPLLLGADRDTARGIIAFSARQTPPAPAAAVIP